MCILYYRKLFTYSIQCYCLLLKQEKAAVFCNYTFTAVAMQDFDAVKQSLKVHMYGIVLFAT